MSTSRRRAAPGARHPQRWWVTRKVRARITPGTDPEAGFAMILVVASSFILTAIAVAALAVATQGLKPARHEQDYQAAIQAAQAGVDDYLHHLNVCDTYWDPSSGCYAAQPANPAFTTSTPNNASWASAPHIPGTNNTSPGQYLYRVVGTPVGASTLGIIRLQVWGSSNGVTRDAVVDLQKPSFLRYIYFTNYESRAPSTVAQTYPAFSAASCENPYNPVAGTVYTNCSFGGGAGTSGNCAHHYYDDGTGARSTYTETGTYKDTGGTQRTNVVQSLSCDIAFGGGDSINGPLHTNDAIYLGGAVSFTSAQTETSWSPTNTPAAPTSNIWRDGCSGCSPANNKPVYSGVLTLPPTNASIKQQTASGTTGCLYSGPTQITLRADGKMDVISPYTTSANTPNTGCYTSLPMTTVQTVPVPSNGVVYVGNFTGTCVNSAPYLGMDYPQALDITPGYDCHNGDAFVKGTLSGKLTIATDNDINVVGDTVYAGGLTGTDVLGLVANGFVQAYHPVSCPVDTAHPLPYPAYQSNCVNMTPPGASGPLTSLTIDAAVLSVANSFRVQNYNLGAGLSDGSAANKLHVNGAIIQQYRGIVANSGCGGTCHGYLKDYNYDSRLAKLPPPYFLNPTSAPWQVGVFAEQQ